jgi:hypothetical protein
MIEEVAKMTRRNIIKHNLQAIPRPPLDPIFTEDEKIEILTREIVQGYKAAGLGPKLIESADLERVLFDVVYPLFGSRQKAVVDRGGEAESSEGAKSREGAESNEGAGGSEGAKVNEGARGSGGAECNERAEGSEGAEGNEGTEVNEGAKGSEWGSRFLVQ